MRRTWLIISDGDLAGFDAKVPSLALKIDRGFLFSDTGRLDSTI
jgi:hypothetical protein